MIIIIVSHTRLRMHVCATPTTPTHTRTHTLIKVITFMLLNVSKPMWYSDNCWERNNYKLTYTLLKFQFVMC